jgi:acetyl-CoA carboxylase biotin carboxyl carrier protein
MMDVRKIEELIRVMEASATEELCVQKGEYKVCIRKGAKPAPARAAKPVAKPSAVSASPAADVYVNAPMVGIFHTHDGIARVGASIAEGQVVGAIESMKLDNDIKSKVSGVIRECTVNCLMP